MTGPAARKHVKQMRTLRSRPRLAAAMGEGWLGESVADRIVAWTRRLPAGMLDVTDELPLIFPPMICACPYQDIIRAG
jgi:hypothetical protein